MATLVRNRRSPGSGPDIAPAPRAKRLGPYRLCLELAAGGMGTVYLARTRGQHGFVAVKRIHPHLAQDPTLVEMFLDEAEVASRIRHGNVCTVFDYDGCGDEYYLAMEYLVGEPAMAVWRKLSRRASEDAVRLAGLVARVLADACEGLHAAHELRDGDGEPLRVVHRDVSLLNLFVTYDGVAKVVDFGVARAASQRHKTRTGIVKGNVAYIAPELLGGAQADRRVDIWGIGVVAWELLTGQRLFRTESDLDTLRAVARGEIVRPSELRPGLPKTVDVIVKKALATDPGERFATARELGRALARVAADAGVLSSADVAEWMDELFPGGRERQRQLLDLAAQIDEHDDDQTPLRLGRPARSSPPPTFDDDVAATQLFQRGPGPLPHVPAAEPTIQYVAVPTGAAASTGGSGLGRSMLAAGTLALGILVGGGAAAALLLGSYVELGQSPARAARPLPDPAEAMASMSPAAHRSGSSLDVAGPVTVADGAAEPAPRPGPFVVELDESGEQVVLRIAPRPSALAEPAACFAEGGPLAATARD